MNVKECESLLYVDRNRPNTASQAIIINHCSTAFHTSLSKSQQSFSKSLCLGLVKSSILQV